MKSKKAVCISCFNYYDNRLKYVKEFLEENNYETFYITSDFDHIKKEKFQIKDTSPYVKQISVVEYTKNISLKRVISHIDFSLKIFAELERLKPDLIYTMIPPNYLGYQVIKYKNKNKKVKIILDIYDLWPESFPIEKVKKFLFFPLSIWSDFRYKAIKSADLVYLECSLYEDKLKTILENKNTEILYLTKEKTKGIDIVKKNEELSLCYLGSINNIIDIDLIISFLSKLKNKRNFNLHVIGEGEKKEYFLEQLYLNKINYNFHGAIFDENEKKKILANCDFGLNIMKPTVSVGLTMKSIDYFDYNLPIINSIGSDTYKLVKQKQIGFNLNRNNIEDVIETISTIDNEEILRLKLNVNKVFKIYFSVESFKSKLKYMIME